jgi:Domain of unknown function (DUF4136)
MKRVLSKMMLAAAAGVFMLSCYPAGPEYVEDLDVVFSSFDEEYNFQSKATYAMPDKIVTDVEIDKNGDTTYVYMKDVYAKQILDAIASNMSKLGWERKDIAAGPDVLLTPSVMSTTTVYYSYWYDWWYGGYYGGWYYPPYYTVSSYTTGSMIMTMSDPNLEGGIIDKSPAIWISAANGLVTGYNDVERVITAINQAFVQSPYLKTN